MILVEQGNNVVIAGGVGSVGSRLIQLLEGVGIQTRLFDWINSPIFPSNATLCDVTKIETLSSLKGVRTMVNSAAVYSDNVK